MTVIPEFDWFACAKYLVGVRIFIFSTFFYLFSFRLKHEH